MIWVYLILLLVSSIIWIVFMTKFWKMCNDVRDIKKHLTDTRVVCEDQGNAAAPKPSPFKVGDTVIYPPTRKVLVVNEIFEDGSVSCYAPEGDFNGVFDASELKKADK